MSLSDLPYPLLAPFAPETVPVFIAFALILFGLALYLSHVWRPLAWSDSRWLLALAILLRLALIPVEPVLGRDIYRYLWEGRIQLAGFNPYIQPPSDPALVALRDEYYERIDHPDIPTVYPPLAQLLFRLSAYAHESPRLRLVALKTILVAFDVGLLLLLFALARNRPVRWPLYAFHPVSVLEIAWNGHVDVVAVFFLVLAVVLVLRQHWFGAALALIGGVWSKLIPALAGPFLVRLNSRSVPGIVLGGVLALGSAALYFDPAMLQGLTFFSRFWTFNSPLFGLVAWWQGEPAASSWRIVSLIGLLLAFAFYFLRPGGRSLAERIAGLYFFLLLLSPVVHPWYALVLVPLLAMLPAGRQRAGLLLSGSLFLSYQVYDGYLSRGEWREEPSVLLLVWGPVLVLWMWDAFRSVRERKNGLSE